ncbi:MAG TPA: ABC transporter substrate-binding protein [Bradyrhizobium sp.]|nr:ABC transporter substrate-binding protein [Bradyrhizobium sp.]
MIAEFRRFAIAALASLLGLVAQTATMYGESKYDPGASDAQIKIGNIVPYSGPASTFSVIGKTEAAFFQMINDQGGINGRKINFISYDDGYSPPKTVEQARRLVESDEVLLLFSVLGTAPNSAIQKYVNSRKIPNLFVASGAEKWSDPKNFPWTMGWQPSYQIEGRIYAKYLLENYPNAKIGVLFQNDDSGKDYLIGLREGLGDKAKSSIVAEVGYEISSPTVESQLQQIKAYGPDVLIDVSAPKFTAQVIRRLVELNWKPLHIVVGNSRSLGGVIKPAGIENSQGIISAVYTKDALDPQWKSDPAMVEWNAFMDKYFPDGDRGDASIVAAYGRSKTLVQVLKQCGDNLTRENVMKQAANLDIDVGVLLPGIRVKTSPSNFSPIQQFRMVRFMGEKWEAFGELLSADLSAAK